jgi:peptide/nickel transport system substrate-binding protein
MVAKNTLTRRQFHQLAMAGSAALLPLSQMERGANARAALQDETPQPGGSLRVAIPADVVGFDIRVRGQNDNPTRSVWELIMQPLVRLETDLSFQPCLATEWSSNEDASEYTFVLRQGVTFHNGDAFTADDVVFTYRSMLDPDFESSTAGQFRSISAIEKVDDFTVKFTLVGPDAEFVDKISRMGILPGAHTESVGSDAFNTSPVGTGPFSFTEWVPETRVKLTKFATYWETGKPYLDEVTYFPIVEDSVRIASLESGELDMWQRNVPAEDAERLGSDPRFVLTFNPFIYYHFMILNVEKVPMFQQKAVRQAVAYSIDRQLLTEAIGYGQPGRGPISPASPYFNPDLPYYTYDPEKAKSILAEAGIAPEDVSFTLQTFTYPDYQKIGELSYELLKDIGFNVELRIDDWSVVSVRCYLPEAACDAFNSATGGLGPDAAMYNEFHSTGSENIPHYSNPRVDELLDQGRATVDFDARKALYDEALTIILEESARIFINDQDMPVISWAYVKGFEPNPMYSYAQLDRTWIDAAAKDELS